MMTPVSTVNLLRALFVVFCGFVGAEVGGVLKAGWAVGLAVALVFSLMLVLVDRLLRGFTLRAFSSATFGLLLGLVFATLLRASRVLYYLPPEWEWGISLFIYIAFGYLGMMLAIRSNRDEFSLLIPYVRFTRQAVEDEPVVVDTSVIIDGRIPEVASAGFVGGTLVVPRFVMEELQALGDSADPIKRDRGRRGLDHLERLRTARDLGVTIQEDSLNRDPTESVDHRLLLVAKRLGARLLTNDSALGKIARLQGVRVMNLNDLAKAMRPVVNIGDETELHLVKEGREPHQAIGYMADGTMIVVNQGRPHVGQTVSIIVTSTLMTSAGRLVFAELSGRPRSEVTASEERTKRNTARG